MSSVSGNGSTSSGASGASVVLSAYRSTTVTPYALKLQSGLLSGQLDGLALSAPVSTLPASRTGNSSSPYVTVTLPIDPTQLKGRKPDIQTVTCQFWDASIGGFSSSG